MKLELSYDEVSTIVAALLASVRFSVVLPAAVQRWVPVLLQARPRVLRLVIVSAAVSVWRRICMTKSPATTTLIIKAIRISRAGSC